MLIDWFTVAAQCLNFLVLAWLLKRYLYLPIRNAIQAREQRIANELAQADASRLQAQQERDDYQNKKQSLQAQCDNLLSAAQQQAAEQARILLAQAQQSAQDLRAAHETALAQEYEHLRQDLARRNLNEVIATTRQLLSDLADVSLEDQICARFCQRLLGLDTAQLEQLQNSQASSANPVWVRSGQALSAAQQAKIQTSIDQLLQHATPLQFQINPSLICGIEMQLGAWILAWHGADYLATLAARAGHYLDTQPAQTAAVAPSETPHEPSV